jgi:hypothetical protein
MKKNLIVSVLFVCILLMTGFLPLKSITIEIPWHVIYGTNDVGPFSFSNSTGVIVSEKGEIYTTGFTLGWDIAKFGTPLFDLNSLLEMDAFVAKWDSNGVLQWYTFLGCESWDYGEGIDVDRDGNVYVSGSSGSDWETAKYGTPLTPHQDPTFCQDGFVAKLSPRGKLLWYTFLGGHSCDNCSNIKVSPQGNVFVSGYTNGEWNTFVYGDPILEFNTNIFSAYDVYVAKLNTDGLLQWYTFLGSDFYDYPYGLTVAPGENVYVTGHTLEYWNSGKYGDPITDRLVVDQYDGFIAKLNGSGEFQWYTFIGEDIPALPASVDFSVSGNIFVTGFTQNTLLNTNVQSLSSLHSVPGGSKNGILPISESAFVASFTFNGEKNWFKTPNISKYSMGASIDVGPFGDLFVTGAGGDLVAIPTVSGAKTGIGPVSGLSAFLMKMSQSGNVEWIEHFTKYPFGAGNGVATFDKGLIYVTGNNFGFGVAAGSLDTREGPVPFIPVDSRVFLVQVNQLFDVNVLVKTTGGTVENDHFMVRPGQDCLINIFPDAGYEIAKIFDNGTETVVSNPYLIATVHSDHEIEIYFRLVQYPPELLLTGLITADNAWILNKDFADLTITITEHATSPIEVKAYVLYKYIDGEWKELTRYTEAGVYNYKDESLTSGDEMYILKALSPGGSVIAETDILIL